MLHSYFLESWIEIGSWNDLNMLELRMISMYTWYNKKIGGVHTSVSSNGGGGV